MLPPKNVNLLLLVWKIKEEKLMSTKLKYIRQIKQIIFLLQKLDNASLRTLCSLMEKFRELE